MANLTPQNLAVAKLYVALMNRAPDASGFAFWVQAFASGASPLSLARTVLGSPETLAIYSASQTNEQFVTSFYTSVFGRAPDADGLAFWSAALAAQGGAGSVDARAALVLQIVDIVSTPLAGKPAGMSDAAYSQTVADRARFTNKLEFSVYFADELKSNDMALAKATLALITDNPLSMVAATKLSLGIVDPVVPVDPPAIVPLAITAADAPLDITTKLAAYTGTSATVDATNMSAAQLVEVAAGASKIAANGITGALTFTSAIGDTAIGTLAGKYTGTTALVNAATMTPTQLAAVAAASGKIAAGGISSLALALNLVGDTTTAALLSKATGATVVATGGSELEVSSLVSNLGNIAAGGITGTLPITYVVNSGNITALFGKYTGTAAIVDATSMTAAQLIAVGTATSKIAIDGITGNLVLNVSLSDTQLTALLGNRTSSAADVQVTSSSMDAASVVALAAGIAKIDGIIGTLALTSAVTDVTGLFAKYTGTTASVNVTGMVKAQLDALLVATSKITATGITGTLALNESEDAVTTDLLSKSAAGALSVVATGGSSAEMASVVSGIAKIGSAGLGGSFSLTDAQVTTITPATLNAKLGTAANLTVTGATAGKDTIDVTGITKAVKVEGGAGADVITVKAIDTVIIASTADSRSSFSDIDATMANIEQITGFVNTGRIQLSSGNGAYGAFALTGATDVKPFFETDVALTTGQTFADLYAAFALLPFRSMASSATELYAYVLTVTGSSSLHGRYLIINDDVAALNANDFIVSVGSAMLDSGTFVIV